MCSGMMGFNPLRAPLAIWPILTLTQDHTTMSFNPLRAPLAIWPKERSNGNVQISLLQSPTGSTGHLAGLSVHQWQQLSEGSNPLRAPLAILPPPTAGLHALTHYSGTLKERHFPWKFPQS